MIVEWIEYITTDVNAVAESHRVSATLISEIAN